MESSRRGSRLSTALTLLAGGLALLVPLAWWLQDRSILASFFLGYGAGAALYSGGGLYLLHRLRRQVRNRRPGHEHPHPT